MFYYIIHSQGEFPMQKTLLFIQAVFQSTRALFCGFKAKKLY